MSFFLTFTLAAPLASFGSVAVGERRASYDRPTKSAILGLVAGALGLERHDEEAHRALAGDFAYAVRSEGMHVRSPRRLMSDYHTAQAPPRGRKQTFPTRREELADRNSLGTILSYREYRSDCSFSVALWQRWDAGRFSLEEIAAALRKPIFVPYAGRKACPLMLPMWPLVVEAEDVMQAFANRDAACKEQNDFRIRFRLGAAEHAIAFDAEAVNGLRVSNSRREQRRDRILSRVHWQFGLRDEIVASLQPAETT